MNFNEFKKYISKSNYLDESSWDEFDGIDDEEDEDDFEEQEICRIEKTLERWLRQFCNKYKLKRKVNDDFDVTAKVTPEMVDDLEGYAQSLRLTLKVNKLKNSVEYKFWYIGMRDEDIVGSITFRNNEINESSEELDAYADRLTNYGMNCYDGIEQDVLKIFAKHGIIFNSHRYGYTSEYTCPGALLKFDSVSYQFRTGRADFDKKAKLILNDIKYLLPKYKSFYWNGKTISGNARNGEVRTAQI